MKELNYTHHIESRIFFNVIIHIFKNSIQKFHLLQYIMKNTHQNNNNTDYYVNNTYKLPRMIVKVKR